MSRIVRTYGCMPSYTDVNTQSLSKIESKNYEAIATTWHFGLTQDNTTNNSCKAPSDNDWRTELYNFHLTSPSQDAFNKKYRDCVLSEFRCKGSLKTQSDVVIAKQNNKKILCYEGGNLILYDCKNSPTGGALTGELDFDTPTYPQHITDNSFINAICVADTSEEVIDIYSEIIDSMQSAGMSLANHLSFVGRKTCYGVWSMLESKDMDKSTEYLFNKYPLFKFFSNRAVSNRCSIMPKAFPLNPNKIDTINDTLHYHFCYNDTIKLFAMGAKKYNWISNTQNITFNYDTTASTEILAKSGTYLLNVKLFETDCCGDTTIHFYLNIDTVKLNFEEPSISCYNDTFILKAPLNTSEIKWSTGESSASIKVFTPNNYTLKAKFNECTFTKIFTLEKYPYTNLEILSDSIISTKAFIRLKIHNKGISFPSNEPEINLTEIQLNNGWNTVKYIDSNKCVYSKNVKLIYNDINFGQSPFKITEDISLNERKIMIKHILAANYSSYKLMRYYKDGTYELIRTITNKADGTIESIYDQRIEGSYYVLGAVDANNSQMVQFGGSIQPSILSIEKDILTDSYQLKWNEHNNNNEDSVNTYYLLSFQKDQFRIIDSTSNTFFNSIALQEQDSLIAIAVKSPFNNPLKSLFYLDATYSISNLISLKKTTTNISNTKSILTIYPIPFSEVLTIESEEEISGLSIYNNLGVEILQLKPDNKIVSINTEKIRAGSYIMEIKTQKEIKKYSIVKM